MTTKLKAPFPYFGGKSKVAARIWDRLGDVDNYIEPFCGSAAVLLARPHPPRIETVNDADCYVANFWRATQHAPEAVAEHADWPVNEADLHARHRWLVLSDEAKTFRARMRTEPDYYDAKIAGWWCWGLCCWIGGGWCTSPAEVQRNEGATPALMGSGGKGQGVVRVHAKGLKQQRPDIASSRKSKGLRGVHGSHEGRPQLADAKGLSQKRPRIAHAGGSKSGDGVHSAEHLHRPQLADAYARGRGVHGNDAAGTCEQRRAWLCEWFGRLRDRLRTVRVCCGDWLRVCDSESVTTRLGVTGIFFDPPYGTAAKRDSNLYAVDSLTVAQDVLAYCLERGKLKDMRIVLAGYVGEGHEILEANGWTVEEWKASGGYGNRTQQGKENAAKERLWCSPHCKVEATLFD